MNIDNIKNKLKPYIPEYFRKIPKLLIPEYESINKFSFKSNGDVKKDIIDKYKFNGDLINIFADNKDYTVHKWHHYIPIYDRYLSPYRNKKIRFLEIGVSKGGSLSMWRKYFGSEAIIYGIDIDPKCAKFDGLEAQVRIGSQVNLDFLVSVINEMGGVDIILDDGSHLMKHIKGSLEFLFPKLNNGGIYIIEDLHTAFWGSYGGGYKAKSNFFTMVFELINDMHHWYHIKKLKYPSISKFCTGVHIHDSIVILEKDQTHEPTHSQNK
jgi:hypothetical protein